MSSARRKSGIQTRNRVGGGNTQERHGIISHAGRALVHIVFSSFFYGTTRLPRTPIRLYKRSLSPRRHSPVITMASQRYSDDVNVNAYSVETVATDDDSDSSSSSEEEEDDAALQVRLKAFELLNQLGGPEGDDSEAGQNWPQRPSLTSPIHHKKPNATVPSSYHDAAQSSYQQSSAVQPSFQNSSSSLSAQHYNDEGGYHYQEDRLRSSSGFVDGFVHCVSEACKMGASEIVSQQATYLKAGYQTLRSVVVPEVEERVMRATSSHGPTGSYQTVQIPSNAYRGRYSDSGYSSRTSF